MRTLPASMAAAVRIDVAVPAPLGKPAHEARGEDEADDVAEGGSERSAGRKHRQTGQAGRHIEGKGGGTEPDPYAMPRTRTAKVCMVMGTG